MALHVPCPEAVLPGSKLCASHTEIAEGNKKQKQSSDAAAATSKKGTHKQESSSSSQEPAPSSTLPILGKLERTFRMQQETLCDPDSAQYRHVLSFKQFEEQDLHGALEKNGFVVVQGMTRTKRTTLVRGIPKNNALKTR